MYVIYAGLFKRVIQVCRTRLKIMKNVLIFETHCHIFILVNNLRVNPPPPPPPHPPEMCNDLCFHPSKF
jgi:hypothetical protein